MNLTAYITPYRPQELTIVFRWTGYPEGLLTYEKPLDLAEATIRCLTIGPLRLILMSSRLTKQHEIRAAEYRRQQEAEAKKP